MSSTLTHKQENILRSLGVSVKKTKRRERFKQKTKVYSRPKNKKYFTA